MTGAASREHPLLLRLFSAIFYACASVFIVFLNKIILSGYAFPSFLVLGLGQIVATVVVLRVAKLLGIVSFMGYSMAIPRMILPLPVFYAANVLTGLGSTKNLSLPMFVVLRRMSILMTMVAEYFFLNMRFGYGVKMAIGLMMLGSVIAAVDDLSFDLFGYVLITMNNLATTGNGIYMKKKLNANELNKWGILYYNALFSLPFCIFVVYATGDLHKAYNFKSWHDVVFQLMFLVASISGFVLNYSIVMCTMYNSPLTTTCVGAMKNMLVTYAGMLSGGGYVYSVVNFVGINVSVVGSLMYNYVVFRAKPGNREKVVVKNSSPLEVTFDVNAHGRTVQL